MSLPAGAVAETLAREVDRLGLADPRPPEPEETIAARRRRRGAPRPSPQATVSLVRIDGELRWVYQRPPRAVGPRRGRRAAGFVRGEVEHAFSFQEVPPNQVVKALEDFDRKLTPDRGLRRWAGGALVPAPTPLRGARALLLVHGTFSKSDMFFEELRATAEGRDFLARAEKRYGHILAFDHPTLCVSPVLNAFDLAEAIGGFDGTLDVVCHSRGGLVTSWWLRTGARKVGRVVFVGAPLEGTSLAAPARLKDALDGLASIADAMARAAVAVGGFVPPAAPILGAVAGLVKIVGRVLSVGASTPLLDAGVSLVPGLAAQSRVANDQELSRLHEGVWPSRPEYFAVRSSFEPGDPDAPWWKFWRRWGSPLAAGAHAAAGAIFEQPNDLVVERECMNRLVGTAFPQGNVHDFDRTARVHHCNYFAQPATATFLARALRIPT